MLQTRREYRAHHLAPVSRNQGPSAGGRYCRKTMLLLALFVTLSALSGAAAARAWGRPFSWALSRRPAAWRWSEGAWLGLMAGNAVGAVWFLSAGVMTATTGAVADVSLVVFIISTVLQGTLFLFGRPSFLMPPAFRGSFGGWLRRKRFSET